jgi:hypothetical protein
MMNKFELKEDGRLAPRAFVVNDAEDNGEDDGVGFQTPNELASMAKYMHDAYLVSFHDIMEHSP